MRRQPTNLLASLWRSEAPYVCQVCRQSRAFTASTSVQSGHSKWATIKHDKAKNDNAKNKQRTAVSQQIINASRFYGPDPTTNPQLAQALLNARKFGVPKALVESAIARGQGRSASGAVLESVNIEAIFPPGVAVIIECQTDNKAKTLADVRLAIKDHDGSLTPTSYLFTKKGRIVLRQKDGLKEEEVLEAALEAGALDIIDNANGIVVFSDPTDTIAVAESLTQKLGAEVESTEILWHPNEDTKSTVENEADMDKLNRFLEKVSEQYGFQRAYTNLAEKPGNEDDMEDPDEELSGAMS